MRKIAVFNMVTVDGYFAGLEGNIDWHVVDPAFDRWAAEAIAENDTVLLGRMTYELFAGYWPGALTNSATAPDDLIVAKALDKMTKIVFSKTLQTVDWHNSKLLHEIDPEEIQRLKKQGKGKDIIIYGSGTIVQQLTALGLIDEYRFMINPVILGAGKTMFQGLEPIKLKLIDTKSFSSGNVLLTYSLT